MCQTSQDAMLTLLYLYNPTFIYVYIFNYPSNITIKKLGQLNPNKLFNIIFYVILTQKVVADSEFIVGKDGRAYRIWTVVETL